MTDSKPRKIPDDPAERLAMAEELAEEVRQLRASMPANESRESKVQRKRILLQIDVRRWQMHILNPKKYGPTK